MKYFNLLKTMFLLCALIVGSNVWAADKTYSLTPNNASTGNSLTVYITTLTSFTYNGISWEMNQWNPSSLQVKTNQSSAANEFRFYNTSAFAGRIKQVVITFETFNVIDASKLMFLGGTAKVSETTGGTAGTWNSEAKTLTWTPGASDDFTYFAFYQNGKAANGNNYLADTDAIVVTYEGAGGGDISSKEDPELVVEDDFEMEVTTTKNADDLWAATSDGEVTFETSDATVAKVVGDKLEAYKPGTATITVNIAETETYSAASDSFVVTVTTKPAKPAEGAGAGTGYTLVTDASTLADGDKLLMVGVTASEVTKAMGGQNTNNRAAVAVAVSGNSIAEKPADAQEITLEGTAGAWYFNVGDGYLYAASSDKNYLRTETEKDNNAKATISIDAEGYAEIVFQGANTNKFLRFNNGNLGLFSCYGENSSIKDKPQLYRLNEATSFETEIGEAGWKTIVTAVNVQVPDEVTAYIASVSDDKVQLAEVKKLRAGEPYILKGVEGTYELAVVDDYDDPSGNELKVSTETDGNGVFVLAKKNDVVGFYKWTGGSLGAGRVILPANVASAAREFLAFDEGETTSISEKGIVKSEKFLSGESVVHNATALTYDLQGRRVAQPTKGLYIVNGKKILLKNIK